MNELSMLLNRIVFAPADEGGAAAQPNPTAGTERQPSTAGTPPKASETAPGSAPAPTAAPAGDNTPTAEPKPSSEPAEPGKTALTEAPKAPEPITYADFKLPEGTASDDPMLGAFKDAASKLGVSQEHAQSIIDAVAPALKASAEAAKATWDKLNTDWQAEVKKEFTGAAFETMKTNVGRAFDEFVGAAESAERKALNEALLLTGAGNNPHIVRLIARMSEALSEGTPVHGRSPGAAHRDVAATMYPTHSQKQE